MPSRTSAPRPPDYLSRMTDSWKLERSKFTAAGEIANERLIEAATESDRYPEGTAFIAADQQHFSSALAEALAEHRPLAIVYSDGREVVAAPH